MGKDRKTIRLTDEISFNVNKNSTSVTQKSGDGIIKTFNNKNGLFWHDPKINFTDVREFLRNKKLNFGVNFNITHTRIKDIKDKEFFGTKAKKVVNELKYSTPYDLFTEDENGEVGFNGYPYSEINSDNKYMPVNENDFEYPKF